MKKFFVLAPIVAMSLTACSLGKHHNISEYILDRSLTLNEKGEFKILQLTDIHLGDKDNQDLHLDFMKLTVEDAKPNFIVVTGDVFTFAGKATAQRLFGWLNDRGVPWTVTWGNHDEQCYFSVDWMTGYLNDLSKQGTNCYFKDIQDDDIQGNSNFAINLNDKDGKLFEQFIIMDSNRYDFNPSHGLYYDAFKPNQIQWYSDMVDYTKTIEGAALNANGVVESIMFYHIPLPEINKAFAEGKNLDGVKNEETCPPDYNTGFFDVIKKKGSTHAMFFGHDHINDFKAEYDKVLFAYGLKATSSIYSNDDLLGGQTITIKADHSLEIERIFHTYAEVK